VPCVLSHYIFNDSSDSITNKEDYSSAIEAFDSKNFAPSEIDLGEELSSEESNLKLRPIFQDSLETERESGPVSVIVPSFNIPEVLALSARTTLATLLPDDELIIVDNGSSIKTQQVLSSLSKSDNRVRIVRNRRNEGFSRAVNQGAEIAAKRNDLIIFNNDAIPFGSWVSALSKTLHSDGAIGAVVPQQVLLPETQTILSHLPFANSGREADVNVSWHHRNISDLRIDQPGHELDLAFAPFFCVMVKRHIFDEIGGLNEILGAHYRSDRNFCNALRDTLKKRLVYVHAAKVYHLLQRSTRDLMVGDNSEFERMFVRNVFNEGLSDTRPIWDQI
jgi:GT2 family glycosyltransferase